MVHPKNRRYSIYLFMTLYHNIVIENPTSCGAPLILIYKETEQYLGNTYSK